eukprot:scaffold19795_cov126-Isochrysis_galbana.AAC.5
MNRSRDRPSPLAWASHISAHTNYGCTNWNLRRGALLIIAVATAKGEGRRGCQAAKQSVGVRQGDGRPPPPLPAGGC